MVASSPQISSNTCPHCKQSSVSTLACLQCGQMLEESDGCNHFVRLGQSPNDAFDADSAEGVYLALSRLTHPDFHGGDDAAGQALAVAHSALLNEAWRVLNDDQLRAEYSLELHDPGALERHNQLSPAFLMEAMELSEELESARETGCVKTIERIRRDAYQAIQDRMIGVTAACTDTIARIAREAHHPGAESGTLPTAMLNAHHWNTEQIATLLNQARVYRRILRDTD
ncbi:MAG: Fe-S protein assembly co-chaperone HscB [Pseudohongiellaceae bacterium]|jgi:Fe-S protein assembly co-chaperone HscB